MFDEHNSFMMLGLLNTLYNKGAITDKERKEVLDLGEDIHDLHKTYNTINKAKDLVREIDDILGGGEHG
jgi:hypothetical protein